MSQTFFAAASSILDPRNRKFAASFHSKQMVLFLILGLGIVLLFGFLYFQEWWVNRRIRRLTELARSKQAQAQALAKPAAPRLPLIRERPPKSTSAADDGRKDAPEAPAEPAPRAAAEPQPPTDELPTKSKRGRLEVHADGPACEVFVDGAFIGNTPARLTVPEGLHLVEVKHPEGLDYRRKIYVSEEADLRLQAFLESPHGAEQPA